MVSALLVSLLDGKIPAPFQTVILLLMVWQHQEREKKQTVLLLVVGGEAGADLLAETSACGCFFPLP